MRKLHSCVQSTEVATAGIDELIKLARPGVDAGVLYADVLGRLIELRSEYFPLALTIDAIGTENPHAIQIRRSDGGWNECADYQ